MRRTSDFKDQLLAQLDSLYRFAMVLSRNREEAEDLVQQTCLKAMENLEQCSRHGNQKAWLFTVLKNQWLNRVRELAARKFVAFEEQDLLEEHHAGHDPESFEVWSALQKLPQAQREIVLLRDLEGFSYDEIALLLDCPAGTVMSRLHRARAQLRTLLEKVLR